MALSSYAGTGTSLSSSFYLRKYYTANTDARTSSARSALKNTELSLADSMALRRAVKSLGSFEYDDTQDTNIRNGVRAYISTYNNLLSSLSDSKDKSLEHNMKQLKSLTNEYSDSLDKLGVTVNEDGTLTARDSLFTSASLSKFETLFSKDSDYMQRATAYGKRMERRSNELSLIEKNELLKKNKPADSTTTSETETTPVAQLVSQSLDLDTLLNTGVGQNVNISL